MSESFSMQYSHLQVRFPASSTWYNCCEMDFIKYLTSELSSTKSIIFFPMALYSLASSSMFWTTDCSFGFQPCPSLQVVGWWPHRKAGERVNFETFFRVYSWTEILPLCNLTSSLVKAADSLPVCFRTVIDLEKTDKIFSRFDSAIPISGIFHRNFDHSFFRRIGSRFTFIRIKNQREVNYILPPFPVNF